MPHLKVMDRKLAGILALLLVSGTALTLAAYFFGVFHFDLKVTAALRGADNPAVATLMTAVSFLGDGWVPEGNKTLVPICLYMAWGFR